MAATRDRILDALERLVVTKGYSQVTLEAVAAAAGVSKGGLLYHFKSKDALLIGMVERLGQRTERQLEAVDSVSDWYLSYPSVDDESDAMELALYRSMIATMRSIDTEPDEVQQALVKVMRSWDSRLQAEIVDPVQAEIVRLVGDGIYLGALLGLPRADPKLHEQVVARLLREVGDPA